MEYLVLDDHLGFLIRRAQQMHAANWQALVGSESTSVQFGVLNLLAQIPNSDQQTLGAVLQVDPSTVTDVVRRLEMKGLIARERDAHDGRRKILTLTARGREELRRMIPVAIQVNETLAGSLDAADASTLRELLRRVLGANVLVDLPAS